MNFASRGFHDTGGDPWDSGSNGQREWERCPAWFWGFFPPGHCNGATSGLSLASESSGVVQLHVGCCPRRACGARRSSEALQASGFWWAGTPGSRWRGNPGLWKSSPTGNVPVGVVRSLIRRRAFPGSMNRE
jgi:hypothetical protein